MRILLISLLLSLSIGCSNNSDNASDPQLVKELNQLVEQEDFFKLKNIYKANPSKLSTEHSLYYSAIVNNVFNKAKESNKDIVNILSSYSTLLADTMLNKLYWTKLLNHVNLYEYGEAAKASAFIQANYSAINDSSEVETLENEIKIWKALENVPKQEILITADATIPMRRDKFGLLNIDVAFGDSIYNVVFDTGANFSVMVRSMAENLGYEIIEADFYVTAATGKKVKSDIAIADEINISGIIFKNVFFLVLEDSALSFPQYDYYIYGAIGFPVIEAMEEIRIDKDNNIFVPQKSVEYNYNNFALNGLMPIIAVNYNGDILRLHFDTGAAKTSLYPQFFSDYKNKIENNYEKQSFSSASGGGIVEFDGYILNNIIFKVADSEAKLDSLRLHVDYIGGEESNFHGNFGQDYIKQFDELIISFKYSSILFK